MGYTSDTSKDFRAFKSYKKTKRQKNLDAANLDGFKKHTPWHYSRDLCGYRLDYWPSKNKWMWKRRVMTGDIQGFIAKREPTDTARAVADSIAWPSAAPQDNDEPPWD